MGKPYENNWLFSDSYVEARTKFRDAAQYVSPTTHDVLTLPGFRDPDDDPLTTDITWHGPQNARGVLILSSGLHGIEGYAGSAIQTAILSTSIPKDLPKDIALVTVHALNPYGFAYGRRVNEDNVDLNRNFIDWSKAPPPDHPLTAEINDLMLPEEKWKFPFLSIAGLYLKHKPKELQKALQQGQYSRPDGLFYGGNKAAWSNTVWRDLLDQIEASADHIAHIDIHSGLGPYGKGEIIIAAPTHSPMGQRAKSWWGNAVKSSADGASVSALVHGDIIESFNLAAQNKTVTQMTLEFGTYAKLDVLHALAMDNWVYVNGMTAGAAFEEARSRMKEAFAPHRDDWRKQVITQGTHAVNAALTGLQNSLKA